MPVIRLRDLYLDPNRISFRRGWHNFDLGDRIVLDLSEASSHVESPSSIRFDSMQVTVLANLLSGAYARAEVDVTLPLSPAILRALARTPLLSSIAHHAGLQQPDLLSDWRVDWNPSDRTQRIAVMNPSTESYGPNQAGLLTLVNPHDRPPSRVAVEVRGLVDPWLNHRFVPAGRTSEQEAALRDIERIMSELTENVADHAHAESTGRVPQSSAQVYTTRGGRDSMDRFVVSVSDNGCGIPYAVRRQRPDLNGAGCLDAVFGGRLRHSSGRGLGLRNVADVVMRNPHSHFTLLTTHLEDRRRALLCHVGPDGPKVEEMRDLPVCGTIAVAVLALPIPTNSEPPLFDADSFAVEPELVRG